MARRDLNLDEERRSYAALWLLGAGLLCVGAIWAVMDDTFLRRPWKEYQVDFFRTEKQREISNLEAEEKRLGEDAKVQDLRQRLAAAETELATGPSAAKVADAQSRLAAAQLNEGAADLQVRFVKSSLEEAWYEYDHAIESGGNVPEARERRDHLMKEKTEREATWEATKADVARIQAEIDELEAPRETLRKELEELTAERERIAVKIEGMKTEIGAISVERIPTIQQIVLPDFDINNFEQPVDRVDRCTSCHVAIDKKGFEELEQPLSTHSNRDVILAKHPTSKFGCTACHDGQGVAVNSPEQAHGDVPFWLHPLLRGEEMQARCLDCHRDVSHLQGADVLARGEFLFEQLGCHGCHLVEGYEDLEPVAPSLRRLSAKVDPGWLVSWVHNPYDFRPRTRMPTFLFDEEQSRAAAAYLWSSSKADGDAWLAAHPDPGGITPTDAAQVAQGKELFDSVGCRACHALAPDQVATPIGAVKDYGPNLANVAQKTSARFVYWWIKDPRGYNPSSRMPSLRLTDDEARSITAYLMSLSEPPAPGAVTAATLEDAALAEQGKSIVRKYGCYGCHAINGMDNESRIGVELSSFASKPLEELFFGNNPDMPRTWNAWTEGKLKNPRVYATEHVEQLMPNFQLAEADIQALRVWLRSRTGRQVPLDYRAPGYESRQRRIQTGRRVIERYNCQGCHQIDGHGGFVRKLYEENPSSAPPILNAEGSKVQPEWFFGFLQDPARQPLRFWLKIRMPTFGLSEQETTQIVDYFTARADLKDPYFFWNPHVDSTPIMLETGEKLMSDEYFSCWSCHVRGSETPEGPQEQWAPNLAYAHERLNPSWILEWIKDPQALMPGTKMPAFYPGGPEDVFGGDEAKQIMSMRDYIMSLGDHGAATTAAQGGAVAPAPGAAAPAAPGPMAVAGESPNG
jgi:mono/diheme cytochrome c family protein